MTRVRSDAASRANLPDGSGHFLPFSLRDAVSSANAGVEVKRIPLNSFPINRFLQLDYRRSGVIQIADGTRIFYRPMSICLEEEPRFLCRDHSRYRFGESASGSLAIAIASSRAERNVSRLCSESFRSAREQALNRSLFPTRRFRFFYRRKLFTRDRPSPEEGREGNARSCD